MSLRAALATRRPMFFSAAFKHGFEFTSVDILKWLIRLRTAYNSPTHTDLSPHSVDSPVDKHVASELSV